MTLIGVDFDGVLLDHYDYMLAKFNEYVIGKPADYIPAYEFGPIIGKENTQKIVDDLYRDTHLLRPTFCAVDTMSYLMANGYKTYIVTAREASQIENVKSWCEKHKVPYSGIISCNNKAMACGRYDYFFEDHPNTVINFSGYTNTNVAMMSYSYNDFVGDYPRVTKIKYLEEAVDAWKL